MDRQTNVARREAVPARRGADGGGDSLTRIVHVSDLHLETGEGQYEGLAERLREFATTIRGLDPDALVVTGDLTNTGSAQAAEFANARRWVESIGVPWLVLPGNHDLGANRTRGAEFPATERYEECAFEQTGWASEFGPHPVTRLDIGRVTIVGVGLRDGDPDSALDALATCLSSVPPERTLVIAGHYPILMPRTVTSLDAFGARGYIESVVPRLTQLIVDSHAAAYLCGHVHLTSAADIPSGPVQITAGGLGPGQCAIRVIDVGESTLVCRSVELPGPQDFWAGIPEAVDPAFSRGTAEEREFTRSTKRLSLR